MKWQAIRSAWLVSWGRPGRRSAQAPSTPPSLTSLNGSTRSGFILVSWKIVFSSEEKTRPYFYLFLRKDYSLFQLSFTYTTRNKYLSNFTGPPKLKRKLDENELKSVGFPPRIKLKWPCCLCLFITVSSLYFCLIYLPIWVYLKEYHHLLYLS